MTDEKKRKLQERMTTLREKYCNKLPEKYQEIENSWKDYRSDLDSLDFLDVFYRHIHTLKGTAATFGFIKQADSCFVVQKLLIDVKENQSVLPEDLIPLIEKGLKELKANIAKPAENISD